MNVKEDIMNNCVKHKAGCEGPDCEACVDFESIPVESADEVLKRELKELIKKHELSLFSFCAKRKDGTFLGVLNAGVEEAKTVDYFECVMNVGRLWQYSRECTKNILNKFEKTW